ncbi:hypothetical protein [Polyangium mundeleinium]|uniref:Uncharacterized protein n=1 Tax=Polyangium mundeleinium TaxID=2995306 RepID=A0ABT5EF49_9BACT|nr:hypothetical protein [Polyangium mundeleinium]MDC0739964.1 hypothetical protein [Polyangium mundeleinium]
MTIDPFLHDESPDTRHDAPTKRAMEGLFADEVASSDGPATRAMSPDEREIALLGHEEGRYGGDAEAWDDDEPAEPVLPAAFADSDDDDAALAALAELSIRSDRKTLPSARFTHLGEPRAPGPWADLGWETSMCADEPATSWDETPVPASEEPPVSSPSIWGRVQQFVARLSMKRTAPNPAASHARSTARALADLVWTMEDADLEVLASHIERVVSLRQLGPEAYAEARILDAMGTLESDDRASGGIPLSALRAHMPEVSRSALDTALLRLEERRFLALAPADDVPERDALHDPKRGLLGRCALLAPSTMGGSRS